MKLAGSLRSVSIMSAFREGATHVAEAACPASIVPDRPVESLPF